MADDATVIDTPEGIALAQFSAQVAALGLEARGMRGRVPVYSHLKKTYGYSGSKGKVAEQAKIDLQFFREGKDDKIVSDKLREMVAAFRKLQAKNNEDVPS